MCEVDNFWQAVENTKSQFYFMENVQDLKKKLFRHSHLINCADYGVPQTRIRRIFTNLPLPAPTHAERPQSNLYGRPLKKWVSIRQAFGLSDDLMYVSVDGFAGCNQKEKTRSVDMPAQTVLTSKTIQLTNYRIYSRKEIESKKIVYNTRKYFHEIDRPARTLTTKDIGPYPSMMLASKKYARKITLKEMAILQGFRSDFMFHGGKTSIRKQIGNALPAAVSKAFFSQILLNAV